MVSVRLMKDSDCKVMSDSLKEQGDNKPIEVFINYFVEQQNRKRIILVGEIEDEFAGYVTICFEPTYPYFKENKVIEIKDLITIDKFQTNGVATALLDFAESLLADFYELIGVVIPVSSKYGVAQQMFIKRGYLPDCLGLVFKGNVVSENIEVKNDENLGLGYIKTLKEKN